MPHVVKTHSNSPRLSCKSIKIQLRILLSTIEKIVIICTYGKSPWSFSVKQQLKIVLVTYYRSITSRLTISWIGYIIWKVSLNHITIATQLTIPSPWNRCRISITTRPRKIRTKDILTRSGRYADGRVAVGGRVKRLRGDDATARRPLLVRLHGHDHAGFHTLEGGKRAFRHFFVRAGFPQIEVALGGCPIGLHLQGVARADGGGAGRRRDSKLRRGREGAGQKWQQHEGREGRSTLQYRVKCVHNSQCIMYKVQLIKYDMGWFTHNALTFQFASIKLWKRQ